MTSTLFTVPIPPLGAHPGGAIVATEPAPAFYLLTITSPPDNRLTTASCTAMLDALDLIEFGGYKPGVVVTTSGIDKFYSNGLDLEHALSTENFLPGVLYKLFHRFLTYPMPTIALLPGHAFAGGLMLAMHHDYRVMNPSRGFACINELEFGVPLKPAMSSIFRLKLPASTYRDLVLEARRFNGEAAVQAGLVDRAGGLDAVLDLVRERKLTGKAKTGIYGLLKAEMYRESVALLSREGWEQGEEKDRLLAASEDKRREEGEKRVEGLKEKAKAKL
ncbi:ClpP/crotonase-like domain-containing protein [Corynascus novoguineensis]|uniref:ClpP/crotonase-like domain-containing protein n=1 Tax=Corynascus novoguineensis TaxID=1126955 RepID=A0AAN7HQS1_9PEZI|nr:ClpP/crotonase-like domain-containing protein [Corynascus novoguineensis]